MRKAEFAESIIPNRTRMLIYVLVLIVVVVCTYLASKSRSSAMRQVLLGVAAISLVVVAGLRNRTVGTDAASYVGYFDRIRTFADVYRVGVETQEYGFWVFTWLLHFVSDQYIIFFFAIALIVIGCYHRAIVTYSNHITISYFVFITSGLYTFFFNGARQGIACAIYALAIGPLLKRRFVPYLAVVLLASLFHKSALAMIPLYLVFNRPNNLQTNVMIVSLGVATTVFLEAIVGMASGFDVRYSGYASQGEGGGYLSVGLGLVFTLFFALFRKNVILHRGEYDRYFNMQLFGTMIGIVSSIATVDPSGFLRLADYSSMGSVLLWPIVLEKVPGQLTRFIVWYVFVLGFIALYALSTQRFSNLIPYTVNPSLRF